MGRQIVSILTSKKNNSKLVNYGNVWFRSDKKGVENKIINIFPELEYQRIEGFGGAITESVAVTLDCAGTKLRQKVLTAYFDRNKGLNYNLCRSHINSCDFSIGNYHYTQKNDKELKTFNIEREKNFLFL